MNKLMVLEKSMLFSFSLIILLSCTLSNREKETIDLNKNKVEKMPNLNNNIGDTLFIDINKNGIIDKVYIKQIDSLTLRLSISFDDTLNIYSDKLIFPIGYLYYEEAPTSDNINMSIDNEKTLIITQEYGDTNPEGWYSQYLSYHFDRNEILVDSVSHEWKNYKSLNDSDFIKRETIIVNQNIVDCDIMSIYSYTK